MPPEPTALGALYDRLITSAARGDAPAAHEAFLAAVGLRARRAIDRLPSALPPRSARMLRYGEPRRIDRIALAAGARPVAKFEDLPLPDAARLERELAAEGLRSVRVGPYSKRFDVAVSGENAPRHDGAASGPKPRSPSEPMGGLYTVIGSRGCEAEAVAEAERDRSSEGTRRAGLALGYPACCVDRFVAVERGEAARREGINEAAIRSIEGLDDPIPWEMNTLSGMAPVGFTPCRARCPEALAFARRLLGALERSDPRGFEVVKRVLLRPILFFRYPLFYLLDGEPVRRGAARAARYAHALPNDDGTGLPGVLRAFQYEEIGAALDEGDEVELDERALTVRREGAEVTRWELAGARVPRLLCFVDDEAS
jgi:hypothetical protein